MYFKQIQMVALLVHIKINSIQSHYVASMQTSAAVSRLLVTFSLLPDLFSTMMSSFLLSMYGGSSLRSGLRSFISLFDSDTSIESDNPFSWFGSHDRFSFILRLLSSFSTVLEL